MQLVTNEMAGLFLIPFGMSTGDDVWNMINQSGLVMLPFFFALVRSWWTARNQGVDEGATSVVAIKFLETSFWPMFLCLIFAAIPISTTPTVVYKQYSCLASPSLFNDLNDSPTATPEALSALNSDKGAYSLVGGLVHTISTGANESMTSKLSCSSGASRQEVNIIVKNTYPATEAIYKSIQLFHRQCYLPTLAAIQEAQSKSTLQHSTTDKYSWAFYHSSSLDGSALVMDAYDGDIVSGQSGDKRYITVPDYWFDSDDAETTIACSSAASALYKQMAGDLLSDDITKLVSYGSLFSSSVTQAVVTYELVLAEYQNVVAGLGTSQQTQWKSANEYGGYSWYRKIPYSQAMFGTLNSTGTTSDGKYKENVEGGWISNLMLHLGSLWTGVVESEKAHAIALIAPLVVVIVQMVLTIFMSLGCLISGFSWKFVYHWSLLYFSVTMVPYFLNLGILLDSILSSLADSSLASKSLENLSVGGGISSLLVTSTASTFTYVIPIIWLLLVQVAGAFAAAAMAGILEGLGESGAIGAQTVLRESQKRAGMPKGGRRQGQGQSSESDAFGDFGGAGNGSGGTSMSSPSGNGLLGKK